MAHHFMYVLLLCYLYCLSVCVLHIPEQRIRSAAADPPHCSGWPWGPLVGWSSPGAEHSQMLFYILIIAFSCQLADLQMFG